jgi:hypothetical protein
MDHVDKEVDAADVQPIVDALFDVGDKLLSRADRDPGMFSSSNDFRVARIAYHLLKRTEPEKRVTTLIQSLSKGKALRCAQCLITSVSNEAEKAGSGDSGLLVSAADVVALKAAWCERVQQLSGNADFIDHPSVAWLVSAWREWGVSKEAVAWWRATSATDDGLLKLVTAYASESRTQSGSDVAWRIHVRVDPRNLEPYGDLQELAERVQHLLDQGRVNEPQLAATKAFLLACERMKAGISPDSHRFYDSEE